VAALSTSFSTRMAPVRPRDSVTSAGTLATCPGTVLRTQEAEVEEVEEGEDSTAEAGEDSRAEEAEDGAAPLVEAGGGGHFLTVKFTSQNVDTSLRCDGRHLCCFRLLNKEFYFSQYLRFDF